MSTKPKHEVDVKELKELFDVALSEYQPIHKRMRILDAADRGKLWKAIQAKFPNYQVLPDTNDVTYVKTNLLAALYSIGRSAHLMPTSEHDVSIINLLNMAIENIWDTLSVPYYQMQAGERAALLNLGVTQIGWDNSIISGTGDSFSKGRPVFKNIDPLKYVRDPYAIDLEHAHFACVWDDYHKSIILRNPKYRDEFEKYLDENKNDPTIDSSTPSYLNDQPNKPNGKGYYRIYTFWIQRGGEVHEYHTVNNMRILYAKEKIKPKSIPLVELYCNLPAGDIVGTSEPSKIFTNSIAYNLMASILLTREVKNQRPPRFVNSQASIDLRSFLKHGSDSDYTFVVNGDASRAVHYQEFPMPSPLIGSIMGSLNADIQRVSGVDGKYTGKDTGSILTTGGIEQMLDQATLIDQPKIVNYERYASKLTELLLGLFVEYGGSRRYFIKDAKGKYRSIEVQFDKLDANTLSHYAVNISPHLPKSKQRIEQFANMIMEKQMQYAQGGQQVNLMTPEEWLRFVDLPMKEEMLERMGVERNENFLDKVTQIVYQYGELVNGGMDAEDALMATADMVQNPGMQDMQGMQNMQGMAPPQNMAPPQDMGQPPIF
jgi:hypothetical protein